MLVYRIVIFPITKGLKPMHPKEKQPWHTDNVGALVTFDDLEKYFNLLKHNGLAWGYNTKPTKIILTVHLKIIKADELFGHCHGFKVCIGARCLVGYIKDNESKGNFLKKRT